MKPEDKLRRLLHAADPEALSQYPMTDEATRRRIRDAVLGEAEPEQKPVTVHRISRIVNAAAVFLLIAGITGGSIAAIQTLRRNPLPPAGQYSSDSTSAAESSTDLPDQMTVYDRMQTGASGYCTGIWGSFVRCGANEAVDGSFDFSCTFSVDYANETAEGKCVGRRKTNTAEEILAGSEPVFQENSENGSEEITFPMTGSQNFCIHPSYYADLYLTDFTSWSVTGKADFIGRTCFIVEGTVPEGSIREDCIGGHFTMDVDEATGSLLRFALYDAEGTLCDWLCAQEIHIEASAQPTEAVTAETEESNIFPDQMTVYDRMLNSQNHFTRVSGQYAEDYGMGFVNVCSFAADLPGMTSNIYLDTVKTVVSAQEIADGAADFGGVTDRLYPVRRLVTTDGKCFEAWEDERMYAPAEEGSELCNPVYPQDEPVDAQTVRDFCMTHNLETDWESVSRTIPAGAWEIADCLFPQSFAMLYLSDFDTWKVQGTETFAGRTCTVIDGQAGDRMNQLEDPCHEQLAGTHFILYVDEATGCLLCKRVYDDQSNLIDWLAVQDITFDEDAAAPDTDLSGYTLIDHES